MDKITIYFNSTDAEFKEEFALDYFKISILTEALSEHNFPIVLIDLSKSKILDEHKSSIKKEHLKNLPVTLVNKKIVLTKRFPTDDEIGDIFSISIAYQQNRCEDDKCSIC